MRLVEIILITISCLSFLGMGVILLRKIPILVNLPATKEAQGSLLAKIKKGAVKLPGAKKFDYELYLQKALSKVRILTLKTESKTGTWLERLRQRRNGHNNDEYWEELKKAKNGK